MTFAVTHLDHIAEREREVQLAHVVEVLPPRCVLLGDLNALVREDYDDAAWAALEARHAAKGWSAPTHGCLAALKGWADLGCASAQPSAHVGEPLYRIDYAFGGPAAPIASCESRVAHEVAMSDHYPVVFDVALEQTAGGNALL